jgi:hypothetical protein
MIGCDGSSNHQLTFALISNIDEGLEGSIEQEPQYPVSASSY